MSPSLERIPALPGSYLLCLYLPRGTALTVGRLGRFHFQRGWYFYCGSAFGPGGLRARLRHHLVPSERDHWHIDYLRRVARPRRLWWLRGHNCEHLWSAALSDNLAAEIPVPGFGASDCDCSSHLLWLVRQPAWRVVRGTLQGGFEHRIESISNSQCFAV